MSEGGRPGAGSRVWEWEPEGWGLGKGCPPSRASLSPLGPGHRPHRWGVDPGWAPRGLKGELKQRPEAELQPQLIKGTGGVLSGFILAAAGRVLVPASGGGSSSSWR